MENNFWQGLVGGLDDCATNPRVARAMKDDYDNGVTPIYDTWDTGYVTAVNLWKGYGGTL